MTEATGALATSSRPYLLGVTGNIACGKSTVMQRLRELGAETLDADRIYHDLIAPGQPLWQTLRDAFGDGIIGNDGTINRRALGKIVFSDPEKLAELDRLTHPAVRAATRQRVAASSREVVAIDAVKLIESGSAADYDQVWLVVCDPKVQIARLMKRNGFSRVDAELRVNAQPSVETKRRLVD
jgi:dephospho-CoA kinase